MVKEEIVKLLGMGMIDLSNSRSPIIAVGKMDGGVRLCVDFRLTW